MATHTDTYRAAQNNESLTAGGASSPDEPVEKDFGNGEPGDALSKGPQSSVSAAYHLDNDMDPDHALSRIKTTGSLSISPELFEKIYLSPQNKVAGELRKTFGNPTPLCLTGFLLSLTPLSCILMGWRGAGGSGASDVGVYYFMGGLLMVLGAVGEWIIGNTFPFVVFGSFGGFWLSFGATLTPGYNATAAFGPKGAMAPGFLDSFAFFYIFMGLLCLVYLVCALRTNIVFVGIFAMLVPAFGLLAAAYWQTSLGNAAAAKSCQIAAGALTFVADLLGWWIFAAIMLASLDFPFQLPVGDLSNMIKGASQKAKEKEDHMA